MTGVPAQVEDQAPGADTVTHLTTVLDRADDLLHRDPQRAEELARWCDDRADGAGLLGLRARARYQRAQVAAERGELDAALTLIAQARSCWVACDDPVAAMRTDLGRMHVLDDLGRHQEAIEVGERLIAEVDRLDDGVRAGELSRVVRAHAVKNLGVAYGLVGRHADALSAYARAESDYLALGMAQETALTLANRGVEMLALGRPGEALEAFRRAVALFEADDDKVFVAQCQGDAAQAHRQLGEVGEALRLLEQARHTLDVLGVATEAARLRLALAETYLAVGLWVEARDAAQLAISATAASGLVHDEAMAQFLLALAELALGRSQVALDGLERAARLFDRVDDRQYAARVALARGEAAARLGRTAEAERDLDDAARRLLAGGWVVPLARARLHQADIATDLERVAWHLDDVRGLVTSLDLAELSYEHELRMGGLRHRQGRLDEAERHLRRALDQLARATGAIPDHALLTAFRADRSRAHVALVDVLLDRGRPQDLVEAGWVADELRAQTLTDLLTQAAGRGPVLTAAGRDLGEAFAELSEHYRVEQQADADGDLGPVARRTDELERRVGVLRLRHLEPGTCAADGPRPPSARTERRAPVLAPSVALHVRADGTLVAFVHAADGSVVVRALPVSLDRIHRLMDDLHDQWSRVTLVLGLDLGHSRSLLRSARHALGALYDVLLAPLADLLVGHEDRLCVVPDARMGAIPFPALFDGEVHLYERWAITVSPSLVAADEACSRSLSSLRATVVGVADDDAPAMDDEARTVAGLLPTTTLLVGPDATVAQLQRHVAGADLVHVACHGIYRPDNPLFSRLRLHDRWMTSAEIVQLDLRGALVVLSACESGTHGRSLEPVGLGWAFLAAGAAGVLVSHWPVDDTATAALMAAFYRHLSGGLPPDQALRRAQAHVAQQQPHPFHWGAFTYLVRPRTFPEERS